MTDRSDRLPAVLWRKYAGPGGSFSCEEFSGKELVRPHGATKAKKARPVPQALKLKRGHDHICDHLRVPYILRVRLPAQGKVSVVR